MPQVFPRYANVLTWVIIAGVFLAANIGGVAAMIFARSPYATHSQLMLTQPVQFSHAHHVNGLGIDCRYCHNSVEDSNYANIPPTKTCMNCHSQIWVGSKMLEPVRESFRTGKSLEWERIHRLSDFVYFDHSIHVTKGVGCASCHGRVDHMQAVYQKGTLLMEWCLDCHRAPERYLRPRDQVFNMDFKPEDLQQANGKPHTQATLGAELRKKYDIRSLIECSTCHR
ncbi:MAG: cytochrome C [Gemmataceae bacterium]|nr:cytochrome C [Gemmataceae bacterium]